METESPRLQVQTRRMVRLFGAVGGAVSVLAVLLYGVLRGGWLDALLAGIALGMSMLPQRFPVVLTVFMAMGAWRISAARVLTRRAAAIETLGSATVLCTDKTGTLTENRMSIAELRLQGRRDLPARRMPSAGRCPKISTASSSSGLLASARNPVDPMEKAFDDLARKHLTDSNICTAPIGGSCRRMDFVPNCWRCRMCGRRPTTGRTSSSPRRVRRKRSSICASSTPTKSRPLTVAVEAMATEGLRVLGVARARSRLGAAGFAARLRVRISGAGRACRSTATRRVGSDRRMSNGWHQGRDDHRRLSGDRARDRAAGGPRRGRTRNR